MSTLFIDLIITRLSHPYFYLSHFHLERFHVFKQILSRVFTHWTWNNRNISSAEIVFNMVKFEKFRSQRQSTSIFCTATRWLWFDYITKRYECYLYFNFIFILNLFCRTAENTHTNTLQHLHPLLLWSFIVNIPPSSQLQAQSAIKKAIYSERVPKFHLAYIY